MILNNEKIVLIFRDSPKIPKTLYLIVITKVYWFIFKGTKAKAKSPIGVKNPKWKTSKKSVITVNKKTGKVNAKKGGRAVLTAKKGKVAYKINVIITDYVKLGKKAYREIKNVVNNPEKLKIYNAYKGYSKQIYSGQKVPVVLVDYGSTNDYGAMVRNIIVAYYDDVHEVKYAYGWNENNIINKKAFSPSKIK